MPSKAFYGASVGEFLGADHAQILTQLTFRTSSQFRGDERQQIAAWRRQLTILSDALGALGNRAASWGLLLEFPISRLRKRLDAVIVAPGLVFVIEFKIGAVSYAAADAAQAEDYALCLRDFHEASKGCRIIPILCAENAKPLPLSKPLSFVEEVSPVICANADSLAEAIGLGGVSSGLPTPSSWRTFDEARYQPVPTIVEAAQAIYRGNTVADIGRADATAEVLAQAAERLRAIAEESKAKSKKTICFVTGTPGAGKTLLGLNLVLADQVGRVAGEPAAFLSGNRPLVHVLTEALVDDARDRGEKAAEVRRSANGAIQTLLNYLRHHTDDPKAPPESVLVYDEAQRAWDAETGDTLLGRRESEPALFLEILDRLHWACLVCLVGPGQEINRGEGGLTLWGEALLAASAKGRQWEVHAAPAALGEGESPGQPIFGEPVQNIPIVREPTLHLSASMRTYRNTLQTAWVDALLKGRIAEASALAGKMNIPPAYLVRSLPALRSWLNANRRGDRRAGLLASSGAIRLSAEGVLPSPRSNDLAPIASWFLKRPGDFRGSNALETPMSEFACQGLELDFAGLCWGNDLVWTGEQWQPRRMQAPRWLAISQPERRQFRLNAYRVLMTRARMGLAIYVPMGDPADPTRKPSEFSAIVECLSAAGCSFVEGASVPSSNEA